MDLTEMNFTGNTPLEAAEKLFIYYLQRPYRDLSDVAAQVRTDLYKLNRFSDSDVRESVLKMFSVFSRLNARNEELVAARPAPGPGPCFADPVNRPSHYTDGKIEVIDFIEDKKLNFHRGNAVKYIARAGKKDPAKEIQDLEKARWYIGREIERIQQIPAASLTETPKEPEINVNAFFGTRRFA